MSIMSEGEEEKMEQDVQSEFGSFQRHKRKGVPMKMHIKKRCGLRSNAANRADMQPTSSDPSTSTSSNGETNELVIDSVVANSNSHEPPIVNDDKETAKSNDSLTCEKSPCEAPSREKLTDKRPVTETHAPDSYFECGYCEFSTPLNRSYCQHMKLHFVGPPFCCDYNGCQYSTDRIQALMHHRIGHTNERSFMCPDCGLCFRTKHNLTTHKRTHTGEKPYRCGVCERSFATKGTLEQHGVTHSDQRPYLCEECGFTTKYQSHLLAHKRIHTGDVFRCQYADCKYATPKRGQLACHMRSHLSIRSHVCAACGRAFVEKSHLVRHKRIHLADKPFACEFCVYTSTRRDKLKEHGRKYHGESADGSLAFKPRRPRRQTFVQHAFPGLSQQQAETQIQAHITSQSVLDTACLDALDKQQCGKAAPPQVTTQVTALLPSKTTKLAKPASTEALRAMLLSSRSAAITTDGVVMAQANQGIVSTPDGRLLSSLQNIDCHAPCASMAIRQQDTQPMLQHRPVPGLPEHSVEQAHLTYVQMTSPPLQVIPQGPQLIATQPTPYQLLPQQLTMQQQELAPASNLHAFLGIYL